MDPQIPNLQHSKSAGIADATLRDLPDLATPLIAQELEEAVLRTTTTTTTILPQTLQSSHHNPNRMTPTNSIARLAQNIQPSLMAPALAGAHTLKVDMLDALVDFGVRGRLRAGA